MFITNFEIFDQFSKILKFMQFLKICRFLVSLKYVQIPLFFKLTKYYLYCYFFLILPITVFLLDTSYSCSQFNIKQVISVIIYVYLKSCECFHFQI